MHTLIANLLVVWLLGLVATLAVYALRSRTTLLRSIALSMLGPVVIAILALTAAARGEAVYLDVALVIAMLGVSQSLIVVRTAEKHEELRR